MRRCDAVVKNSRSRYTASESFKDGRTKVSERRVRAREVAQAERLEICAS